MKSRFEEYRVAITGLPRYIDSARLKPNPSPRCGDTRQSKEFCSDTISLSSIRAGNVRMLGTPATASSSKRTLCSSYLELKYFKHSMTSGEAPNSRLNA